jgi:hypothetical protein
MGRMRLLGLLIALTFFLSAAPSHAQGVTVKFMTTPAGGPYAPRNVTVVWIEDSAGNFVKTIGRWAAQRKNYLVAWVAKAGANDADAVTSATRGDHLNMIQAVWNLQDRNGNVVPDGTYTIKMELADSDIGTQAANNEGTFSFVKSPQPQVQTNQANGGFDNATISYAAQAACGNSVIDPGETCDPPGSCPTSCADSGDKCMPNVLVGIADSCTAQCQQQLVTACKSGDGCCPLGCTTANDSDCGAGGGAPPEANSDDNSHAVIGGCSALGHPAASLLGLVAGALLMLVPRRRRR